MYPDANIPIIQLSLDYTKTASFHYALGEELKFLREEGVRIIGSGKMVHSLGTLDWAHMDGAEYGYTWAIDASKKMKELILNDDHESLKHYVDQGKTFQMAIPTPEHFLPLLYILAQKNNDDSIEFFNDKIVGGSVGMCSMIIR